MQKIWKGISKTFKDEAQMNILQNSIPSYCLDLVSQISHFFSILFPGGLLYLLQGPIIHWFYLYSLESMGKFSGQELPQQITCEFLKAKNQCLILDFICKLEREDKREIQAVCTLNILD